MARRASNLGVDVGGTFTDFVTRDQHILKRPSRRDEPGQVMEEGIAELAGCGATWSDDLQIAHGTTVATNALLTGALDQVVLVVTEGFRDVLSLGRQARPVLYDLEPGHPFPAPDPRWIVEVKERMDASGEVVEPLDWQPAVKAVRELVELGAGSVAVCLLNSFRNPAHEEELTAHLKTLGVPVTASAALVSEFREFERFSTAFANAGLMPLLQRYVANLALHGEALAEKARKGGTARFLLMQSDGGVVPPELAAEEPVRMVLSGPAGGLVGAWSAVAKKDRQRLMTLDMGGTSTDVALMDGGEPVIGQAELAGRPLLVPVLDIHTVGAGGGSVARRDGGGALVVGPESAGANPGPACYGQGGPATVTDAHVFLGRIPPQHFLGGAFDLYPHCSDERIHKLARSLDLSAETCALGILEVAEATMERALRRISLERGHDPREFSLVCFGGAGALHGPSLMKRLNMKEMIVPRDAGVLSARGMLHARLKREYAATLLKDTLESFIPEIEDFFSPLERRARRDMGLAGQDESSLLIMRFCDLRYEGQSHAITLPLGEADALKEAFHVHHERQYGFSLEDGRHGIEVVGIRLRVTAAGEDSQAMPWEGPRQTPVALQTREVMFAAGPVVLPVYARDDLPAGWTTGDPALIVEYSSTVVVPPEFSLTVGERGNLILRRGSAG